MVLVLAVGPVGEEIRYVLAAGDGFDAGPVQIQGCAGHAQRIEDPLLQEVLQRLAAGDVRHGRKQREGFVAVAHVFAGFTQGADGALADHLDDVVDGVHGVGAGLPQPVVVLIVGAWRVDRDAPVQAFV